MAVKKSFKGANPAMQFISIVPTETEPVMETEAVEAVPAVNVVEIKEAPPVVVKKGVESIQEKPAAMKKAPPVKVMTEGEAEQAAQRLLEEAERKTKRLNLLLQPSVLEDLSKIAHMKQKSVNGLINTVLKEYCGENPALIERYDDVFGV